MSQHEKTFEKLFDWPERIFSRGHGVGNTNILKPVRVGQADVA